MNEKVIGTCSNCGGDVVVHGVQYSTRPLPPRCRSCGATARKPVIDMAPPAPKPAIDMGAPAPCWRGQGRN